MVVYTLSVFQEIPPAPRVLRDPPLSVLISPGTRCELEPPSANTGLETPRQTTADGCLLVGVGLILRGNTFSSTECVDTQADSGITTASTTPNTVFLQPGRKPRDKKAASEENKQLDPGGKGEKPLPWKAAVLVVFFLRGTLVLDACCLCFVGFVCACLLVVYCSHQVIIFQRTEKNNGDAKKINEERNWRASIFLPISP